MKKTFIQEYEDLYNKALQAVKNYVADHVTKGCNMFVLEKPTEELEYVSDGNGWCLDPVVAIGAEHDELIFGEEIPAKNDYDFDEDENDIVSAYMNLQNLMLSGICDLADTILGKKEYTNSYKRFEAKVRYVFSRFNLKGDLVIKKTFINYVNKNYFWTSMEAEKVNSIFVYGCYSDTSKMEHTRLSTVPLDDLCKLADAVESSLKKA